MKKILLFGVLIFGLNAFGQEMPDVEAEFPCQNFNYYDSTGAVIGKYELCSTRALQRWVLENLQYPEISMEMGEQGKVFLKFIVEKDGTITNVEVIKGVSRDLDNEAKRLMRSMPRWKPAESKGLKVRSTYSMPLNFELN